MRKHLETLVVTSNLVISFHEVVKDPMAVFFCALGCTAHAVDSGHYLLK